MAKRKKRKVKKAVVYSAGLLVLVIIAAATVTAFNLFGNKPKQKSEQKAEISDLSIQQTSVSLDGIGKTQKLTVTVTPTGAPQDSLKWKSSEEAVATVSPSGTVTSVGGGTCRITVSAPNGKTADSTVTVNGPISVKYDNANVNNTIPVLMYHSIDYEKNNTLRVPKEDFAAEMKWLYDNGYSVLSLDELYTHLQNKTPFPKRSAVLTFDDGYMDNYVNAFPVLKQYGFHATVFMISGKVDAYAYLTSAQLKEMSQNGIDIESHTVSHLYLDTLSYSQQSKELKDSKQALESLLGKPVDFIAYPSGHYNADTIKAAKEAGYKIAFKMNGGIGTLDASNYEFPRMFVGNVLNEFIKTVKSGNS